jgi:NhaP-type Na+/H+ or K+/H+ antiporter
VGGILGAVVFHAVVASTRRGLGYQLGQFLLGIGVGLAVANLRGFDVSARRPFFETLVQLIIGVLFVAISATVPPASLRHLVLPALGLAAVLVLITRPLVAWLATARTDLTTGERLFSGWMAPRGIIAAATASTFSAGLVAQHIRGASKILPVTFLVIVVTVAVYGLTSVPVARRLGVTPACSHPAAAGRRRRLGPGPGPHAPVAKPGCPDVGRARRAAPADQAGLPARNAAARSWRGGSLHGR